jgi:hypothetical protein
MGRRRYYTRKEASGLLDVSASEIRGMVTRGELRYEYVDGKWMIPAYLLEDLAGELPDGALADDERNAGGEQQGAPDKKGFGLEVTPDDTVNGFVAYLNRYTTVSPEQEAAFDEFSSQTDPPSGIKLQLQTKVENFIRDRFSSPNPPSIILTGNAGDGKTYLCRQVIETFSGQSVTDWTDHTDWCVERGSLTMRVVKDLSEISEDSGSEILRELNRNLQTQEPRFVFLVAANEGRLRSVLEHSGHLEELGAEVDRQLRDGPDTENGRLIVFNLNKATTSTYVPQALKWITDPAHWSACQGCAMSEGCPIRFNVRKLTQEHVAERVALLYRILEHLDVHVTIRDMLIHLAYTVTGGLTCDEVMEALHDPDHDLHFELHRRVYYENCWGSEASSVDQRKISAVNHLRHLDVGRYSFFEVDNFIINGDASENEETRAAFDELFGADVDLKGGYFAQRRKAYLSGKTATANGDRPDELLGMLPHCRRKLFFEWDNKVANRLTPFLFLPEYLELLAGDQGTLEGTKEKLVVGLNRALTGLYLTDEDVLYVTSQYAHTVEQPVPVVRAKIPTLMIGLHVKQHESEALDQSLPPLELRIPHPQFMAQPLLAEINLLRFEYLMRLAKGGTPNVLAEECGLFVRELRDKLLASVETTSPPGDAIEFFVLRGNEYELKKVWTDQQGKMRS